MSITIFMFTRSRNEDDTLKIKFTFIPSLTFLIEMHNSWIILTNDPINNRTKGFFLLKIHHSSSLSLNDYKINPRTNLITFWIKDIVGSIISNIIFQFWSELNVRNRT